MERNIVQRLQFLKWNLLLKNYWEERMRECVVCSHISVFFTTFSLKNISDVPYLPIAFLSTWVFFFSCNISPSILTHYVLFCDRTQISILSPRVNEENFECISILEKSGLCFFNLCKKRYPKPITISTHQQIVLSNCI